MMGYCGCCGREMRQKFHDNIGGVWCCDCFRHIQTDGGAPWARTYFAQHGRDCPYSPTGYDGDGLPLAA